MIRWIASFIGLFRISAETEGPDICSGLFLVVFYIMVCRFFFLGLVLLAIAQV